MGTMQCEICSTPMQPFETGTILQKYRVQYFHCPHCGFVKTEEPYWLDEAYSDAICDADIGLLSRNIFLLPRIEALINICFPQSETFLDYGGGYGVFVRLMRDKGIPFEWYDQYCQNLFAKGFEKQRNHYHVITAFELFEHFSEPMKEIENLMGLSDNLIVMTKLIPNPPPHVKDWWYYVTLHGQHISFYTEQSMQLIAERFHRHYVGSGDLHIFSSEPLSYWKVRLSLSRLHGVLTWLRNKESLLPQDYEKITGQSLN